MTKEEKISVFSKELGLIKDSNIRNFAEFCLDNIPEYFYLIPASSTGKYHPPFSLGDGGLVRHTKAAIQWYVDLQRWWEEEPEDEALVALILHDSYKSGVVQSRYSIKKHAEVAAEQIYNLGIKFDLDKTILSKICEGIKGHMGVWSAEISSRPKSQFAKKISLADYCASRKIGFEEIK